MVNKQDYNGKFPTQDSPAIDAGLSVYGLIAHNEPSNIQANIIGAISNLFNELSFVELGSLTPEQAAEYYRNLDIVATNLCDAIADCIANSQNVRDALNQVIEQNTGQTDSSTPMNAKNGSNLLEGVPCTNDELSGAITALQEYVEATARDLLEIFVSNQDKVLATALAVQTAPIIGDLPILNDLSDWVDFMLTKSLADFEAGVTETENNEIFCYIYERVCSTCELNVGIVVDAYINTSNLILSQSDPIDVIMTAIAGTTTARAFAYGLMGMVAGVLGTGGKLFDLVGVDSLKTIVASGTPSNKWTICNPCVGSWCYNVNMGSDNDGSGVYNVTFGSVVTDGIQGNATPQNFLQATIKKPFAASDTEFTRFYAVTEVSGADGTARSSLYVELEDLQGNVLWSQDDLNSDNGTVVTEYTIPNIAGAEVILWQVRAPQLGDSVKMKQVRIEGINTLPFGVDNC